MGWEKSLNIGHSLNMEDEYIFYTSIKKELKKRLLLRAFFLSFFPVLILTVCGIYLPLEKMNSYGVFIFIFTFLAIGWAFIPYQALKIKEEHPDKIEANSKGIFFFSDKKKTFFISLDSIEKMEFIQKKDLYGIGIWEKKGEKRENPDFFFPYFTKNAFKELQSLIDPRLENVMHSD